MTDRAKDAEILALRHQLAVLERQLHGEKIRFDSADRAFLAALLHRLPQDVLRRIRLLARPNTVLRWHRDLLARRHAARSRPTTQAEICREQPLRSGVPYRTTPWPRVPSSPACTTPVLTPVVVWVAAWALRRTSWVAASQSCLQGRAPCRHSLKYRIWRVLDHYVARERAKLDFSQVEKVGMDETAAARGQDYVSIFMDPDTSRVLYATEGRDHTTVERFVADLKAHGGYPEAVGNVTCDMSPAFISGVKQHLSNAEITFDRFHIMKKLGEAVDEVRRTEAKVRPLLLRKTRWLWLTNRASLSPTQQRELVWLTREPGTYYEYVLGWSWKSRPPRTRPNPAVAPTAVKPAAA